jgi:multidrug efflux pump subunit AcrB
MASSTSWTSSSGSRAWVTCGVFGSDFGMRVWLKPDRMASLGITAADVAQSIREQNLQVPAGQVGQPPATRGQSFQYSLRVQGRLIEVDEFADVIVGSKPDGSFIRIRDIGRVELGARSYSNVSELDGKPAAAISVSLVPGANALETAHLVKAELARLAGAFPKGMDYRIVYDTSGLRRGVGRGSA